MGGFFGGGNHDKGYDRQIDDTNRQLLDEQRRFAEEQRRLADAQRQEEAQKQQRIQAAVDKINGMFNPQLNQHAALYDEQRRAVTDLNLNQLNRQTEQAERTNRFGLARAGLLGGSVDADSGAEIDRIAGEGRAQAALMGDQAVSDLKTADARERQRLIALAQSGTDLGQLTPMAQAALTANTANLADANNAASLRSGYAIGDLFNTLAGAYLAHQQRAGQSAGWGGWGRQPVWASGSPYNRYLGR